MRAFVMLVCLAAVAQASHVRGCPRGKFISWKGCTSCPAGKWQSMPSKSKCWDCPTGHFQPKVGLHSCYMCPKGRYQDTTGTNTCKKCDTCDKGSFGVTRGYGSKSKSQCGCSYCKAGRFAPAKSSACYSCPAGRFTPMDASFSCYFCPTGKFQSATGAQTCSTCSKGETSEKGSTTAKSCKKAEEICDVGFFRSKGIVPGSTVCRLCPAGMFGREVSKNYGGHCYSCPDGQVQSQPGKATCHTCDKGMLPTADRKMCHNPETYYVHYRLYSSNAAKTLRKRGWVLPTLAETVAMKQILLADYKLNKGFKTLAGWTPSSCCISIAGGTRLTVNGASYAYPKLGNKIMCGRGAALPHPAVVGLAFHNAGSMVDAMNGVTKLGGSKGQGQCGQKPGETNPAIYMHLQKQTPAQKAGPHSKHCTLVGLKMVCLPPPQTPSPTPAAATPAPSKLEASDHTGTKQEYLDNLHTDIHVTKNNFHSIMQIQSMIENEVGPNSMLKSADHKYSPKVTRKCCQIRCDRATDKVGCQKGCKLWIGHTSLNWESNKRYLLKKQCDHTCEWVAKGKMTFTHTPLDREEEKGCKEGCVFYDECSFHNKLPKRHPVKSIVRNIFALERKLGQSNGL